MTNADVDRLLADLCRADATLDDARAEVRAAGDKLKAAGRRWDELVRRVIPVIKANPGRLCKGRKWDGAGYVECGIYLDEHGCVAIQPIADAYDLAVPMVADAVADSPVDDEPGPASVEPIRYLDGLARFAMARPADVADVPSDVLAYVNDVDGDVSDVLDSRGDVRADVRTEAMAAARSLRDALGSSDPAIRLVVAMAAEDEFGDDGEDMLDRLMGVDDSDVDLFAPGFSEFDTVIGDEVTESGETVAAR